MVAAQRDPADDKRPEDVPLLDCVSKQTQEFMHAWEPRRGPNGYAPEKENQPPLHSPADTDEGRFFELGWNDLKQKPETLKTNLQCPKLNLLFTAD